MVDLNMDELSKELNNDQPTENQAEIQPETPKINIGGKEYTQDELDNAVKIANTVNEVEKKYNTKVDKVWPEYGRSQQRIKELEEELKVAKAPKVEVPQDQQAQIEEAKKAAKQLGILTKDDLKELGIVTKDDFDNYYRLQRETDKILEDANNLEKKLDGSDGRPAFKKEDILQYMQDTGIRDMEVAYKVKFENELDSWRESKLASAKKPGISTMETQKPGNKQPESPKITRDNLNQLVSEALEGKF